MATDTDKVEGEPVVAQRSLVHLRATPEERARVLAAAPPPRSLEEWLGGPHEWSEEDQSDLDWFLQERERLRQLDMLRLEDRLKALDG